MDQQTIQQLTTYLDKIGEKIGIGAKTIWPWFVRQQYINFYIGFTVFFASALLLLMFCIWTKNHWYIDNKDRDKFSIVYSNLELFFIITILGWSFIQFGFLFAFIESISNVLNPEYAAFLKLISTIPK